MMKPANSFRNPQAIVKDYQRCGRILTDAWLTETRHQRPMPPGLPLEKAKETAAAIDAQLHAVLREP
jgi:hypothetical protein